MLERPAGRSAASETLRRCVSRLGLRAGPGSFTFNFMQTLGGIEDAAAIAVSAFRVSGCASRRWATSVVSRILVVADASCRMKDYCALVSGMEHETATIYVRQTLPDPAPVLVPGRPAMDHQARRIVLRTELRQETIRRAIDLSADAVGLVAVDDPADASACGLEASNAPGSCWHAEHLSLESTSNARVRGRRGRRLSARRTGLRVGPGRPMSIPDGWVAFSSKPEKWRLRPPPTGSRILRGCGLMTSQSGWGNVWGNKQLFGPSSFPM